MGGLLYVGDYIFQYAYPIAFLGSMFYGITSLVTFDPASLMINRNITMFINIFIGVCGLISLFNWYQNNQIPLIGPILLPEGTGIIKSQA